MGYQYWSYALLKRFCVDVFRKFGFDAEQADIIQDVLLTADLYGIESHGMQRMVRYHKCIENGMIDISAQPEVVFETPVSAVIDAHDAIYDGREGLNWIKQEMAKCTNTAKQQGSLREVIRGADVFIGVSAPGTLSREMVQTMNRDAIVFACANPTPEIFPEEAKAGGARVVATGRSDYPNQINNVLAFPGIFRGTFDVRASQINEEMKMAAAQALAQLVSEDELSEDYIIPMAFDERVGPAVARAVAEAARKTGVARV